MEGQDKTNKTMIIFSSDLDKVLAAFNIAVGAAAMGSGVSMYFAFWGLNVLRKEKAKVKGKSLMDKMFAIMMPRGADKLSLSKMNMAGIGKWMIKRIMKKQQVAMLPELIKTAQEMEVKFIACQMSMGIMGLRKEELIDGIEVGGVATYLEAAEKSNLNLFI